MRTMYGFFFILLLMVSIIAGCTGSSEDPGTDGDSADGDAAVTDGDDAPTDGDCAYDGDGEQPADGDATDGDMEAEEEIPDTGSRCDIDKNLNDRDVTAKEGGTVQICEPGHTLDGSSMFIGDFLVDDVHVVISEGDDLDFEGWIPVGPAVFFEATAIAEGDVVKLEDDARMAIPFENSELSELARNSHINVVCKIDNLNEDVPGYEGGAFLMAKTPSAIIVDRDVQVLKFKNNHFGTYQAMIPAEILSPKTRHFTYRALTGISMGSFPSSIAGVRFSDYFDIIGPLGGFTDMTYLLNAVEHTYLGGFCSYEEITTHEGYDDIDAFVTDTEAPCGWCGPQKVPEHWSEPVEKCYMVEPREVYARDEQAQGYNHWYYDNNGGGFDRDEYLDIFRDLSWAYGNPTNYNPDSPYLPAGLTGDPEDENTRLGYYLKYVYKPNGDINDHVTGCENLAAWMSDTDGALPGPLSKFYDRRYNPDGEFPVIYYCDGAPNGTCDWVPDWEGARKNRFDLAMAVDFNRNGIRDFGEPVIGQMWEPYEDCGVDGLCDEDETDYNADSNPDPAGDNYSPYDNPTGTEGNGVWEEGEDYQDLGTDGVACPDLECPYDFGEGNGKFDYNPQAKHWLDLCPVRNTHLRTDEQIERLNVWLDGGIRDIFNAVLMVDGLQGAMTARKEALGIKAEAYQGFESLMTPRPEKLTGFRFLKVPYHQLGQSVLVRYGDYNASDATIDAGDGRHVGVAAQTVFRIQTLFSYINTVFPKGDFKPVDSWDPNNLMQKLRHPSASLGRTQKFAIALPAGYFANNSEGGTDADGNLVPDSCVDRYPVVALMHGYGMEPEELSAAVMILFGYMTEGTFQKIITIFPDGKCDSPEQCSKDCREDCVRAPDKEVCKTECETERNCADVIEECEQGSFFSDLLSTKEDPTGLPEGEGKPGQTESAIFDLFEYVDQNFCTRPGEDVQVDGATRLGLY